MKTLGLTKKLLVSAATLAILTTASNAASTEGLSLKIGAGNSEVGTFSESGTEIGVEFSFTKDKNKKHDIFIELSGTVGSVGTTTNYGIGARYEIIPKLYIGASVDVSGYSLSSANSTTSLVGFSTTLSTKYTITKKHGVLAEYRTGTLSDESGLADFDYTGTAINYVYSF